MIAERVARLDEELRGLLTVGSVEGEKFAAEVVARVEALTDREAIRLLSDELQRRRQGRPAQGRELLLACYSRFTEGLEMPDLVEARILLGELGQALAVSMSHGSGESFDALAADLNEDAREDAAVDALGDRAGTVHR